jgi:nucleoside-diphosphate-sugar epimerase
VRDASIDDTVKTMSKMLIFGLGYAAKVLAESLRGQGWSSRGTGRDGDLDFADCESVGGALAQANHVLSSVPPDADGHDPVLAAYGNALSGKWLGYLSSTGVYGDSGGAWVDETAPIGGGRRSARTASDLAWQALGARVFRLPGIYGPGRSPLDRVVAGTAHRIDLAGQVFSRVHVEDIASGVVAALRAPPGVYNLADDLPASQNAVIEEACRLLGREPPPLQTLDEAGLSPQARAFYAENRRIANGKAKRVLGWRPAYPTFREGLRALSAMTSPVSATADPTTASAVQR